MQKRLLALIIAIATAAGLAAGAGVGSEEAGRQWLAPVNSISL